MSKQGVRLELIVCNSKIFNQSIELNENFILSKSIELNENLKFSKSIELMFDMN